MTDPYRCEDNIIHEEDVLAAQQTLVDGLSATRLARTFQALADPTRIRLISALLDRELCVCDLAAVLGMSQSAVSHQLRILRDLHIVRSRRDGRMIHYALDDTHIRDLFARGLEHILHEPAA
ncbi:MAG TPA: metalloregulator ArsR/SmtB family transcription factor [Anaerolineaceae bacterium]|nr:metalloregulator ArsR/SmtB family transcription factor [Anaerolineaceae bacterium]HQP61826.1 metalloregulator ArsR/SmtB family transcription factor [Anaerolineaceae bacterium]